MNRRHCNTELETIIDCFSKSVSKALKDNKTVERIMRKKEKFIIDKLNKDNIIYSKLNQRRLASYF